jgi:ABC-type lipoprotein export system ATPase subunit
MSTEPFIVCDNLVKIHKVADIEMVALQGLDLVVAQGELLGIVGPSGSGKTTLLNILGGLDRPSAGRVWVNGQELLKMSGKELDEYRRSKVGFVWQMSSQNLIPYLSSLENIELPMAINSTPGPARRKRAEELLEIVGLAERRNSRLEQLSGGEQQRVSIAVSLANQPALLLADEPTGEVDTATAQVVYKTFQDINKELGLTTLIVSHDPEIAHHVNRVVAIRDGRTASETVRRSRGDDGRHPDEDQGVSNPAEKPQDTFLELTILDSAGRLQLPKDYVEHFNFKGRVQLQMTEEGILIRPAPEAERHASVEVLATELAQRKRSHWISNALGRLRRKKT